ncbi:DUF6302 family protein [Streptomyces uncialis]|uniref:DUF6302 family protein n=1 Tax=Streptomyces uncialis TaxID=1048205 RepID=UPI003668EF5B
MDHTDEQYALLSSRLKVRGLLEKAALLTVHPEGGTAVPLPAWLAVPVGEGRVSGCLMVPPPLLLDVLDALGEQSSDFPTIRVYRSIHSLDPGSLHRIGWGERLPRDDPDTALRQLGYHDAAIQSLRDASGTTPKPVNCRFPAYARGEADGVAW